MFTQVSGLGCIDLGDRRSRVQISAARQTNTRFEEVADSEREVIVKTARRLGFSKNEAGGLVAALEDELS